MTARQPAICFLENDGRFAPATAASFSRRNVECLYPLQGDWRDSIGWHSHYDPQIDEAIDWLSQRPSSHRGLSVGGWFNDPRLDDRDESKGKDIAAYIVERFQRAGVTLRMVYCDQEGRGNASEVADALDPFHAIAEVVVNFNNGDFPPGCQAWFEYTAEHMDTRLPACGEMYGAGADIERYIDTMTRCNRFVPVFPVCARLGDWSRRVPTDEAIQVTKVLVQHAISHGHRTMVFATYMRYTRRGGSNYFLSRPMNEGDIAANIDAISDALEGF